MAFLNGAPGKYDDLKQSFVISFKLADSFSAAVDKVTDAAGAAAAIRGFAKDYKAMLPALEALFKKYPNYVELTKTNVPVELKADLAKMNVSQQKLNAAFVKLKPYYVDHEVKKAQQEMMLVMRDFQQARKKLLPKKDAAAPAAEKKQ
ncbi:MAG: hypothetical protein GY765_15205 [bacterium]|nr:hypothetical protein [bacterium]